MASAFKMPTPNPRAPCQWSKGPAQRLARRLEVPLWREVLERMMTRLRQGCFCGSAQVENRKQLQI